MKRSTARKILDTIKKGAKSSHPLQIERLKKSDPTWQHHWIVNKLKRLGGVRVRRVLPAQSEQLDALTLVFIEWSPVRRPGNYYLIVLDQRGRGSPLAEIHRAKSIDGTTYLRWTHSPSKKDQNNPKRKAYFAEVYPEGSVELSAPQTEHDVSDFISGLFELAQARLAADQCTSPAAPDEEMLAFEGKQRTLFILHRTRERRLRAKKIEAVLQSSGGRLVCEVPGCHFDFSEVYGELGEGFAHVHHLKPLSGAGEGMHVGLSDLAIVCANCHAMIHKGGECRPLDGLIKRRKGAALSLGN